MNPTDAQVDQMMTGPSAMAITYYPADQKTSICIPLSTIKFANAVWKSLPLVARLGVEIVYITEKDYNHPVFAVGEYRNKIFTLLTTECNPTSPDFGKAGQEVDGGVIFKFKDERVDDRLTKAPLESLELFIEERLRRIKAVLASEGLEAAKKEYEKMSPIQFVS